MYDGWVSKLTGILEAWCHGVIWDRRIDPDRVFDLELPLDQVAEGYRTSDGP